MIYIGIDPGMSGCIVSMSGSNIVWTKIPVIAKKKGGHDYDVSGVNRIILNLKSQNEGEQFFAAVERVSIFPVSKKSRANPAHEKQTSMVTNSTQFYCSGLLHGILTAHNIPFIEVHVISWKKKILEGLGGDKSIAIKYVNNRFPGLRITELPKGIQPNLADAVCIAFYGRMIHLGEK